MLLSSEGNKKGIEPLLRQLIFILTLTATFCLFFFFYFLCIKLFVCLKPKEQNIMWSSNISEAMQAAKSVCLTADDRFRRLSSETKQCAGVTVDYQQNAFSSPKCSEYSQLPGKVFFCWTVPSSMEWGGEQQVVFTLKGFCNWTHLLPSAKQDLCESGVASWTSEIHCRLM